MTVMRADIHGDFSDVRDWYIARRFRGTFARLAELDDAGRVLEVARAYFEDEELERAHELLQLAIDRAPQNEALRMAQLQMAFLQRDAELYLALALQLREELPQCGQWPEIERLGRGLLPREPLFAAARAGGFEAGNARTMAASAEMRAALFHQAMSRAPDEVVGERSRTAA